MKTLCCTVLLALCAITALAADATGKWSVTLSPEDGQSDSGVAILKQNGDLLTGTAGPADGELSEISNGKVDGNKVSFDLARPNGMVLKINLILDGDSMTGDVVATKDGQTMKGKVTFKREKA